MKYKFDPLKLLINYGNKSPKEINHQSGYFWSELIASVYKKLGLLN